MWGYGLGIAWGHRRCSSGTHGVIAAWTRGLQAVRVATVHHKHPSQCHPMMSAASIVKRRMYAGLKARYCSIFFRYLARARPRVRVRVRVVRVRVRNRVRLRVRNRVRVRVRVRVMLRLTARARVRASNSARSSRDTAGSARAGRA